jgi:hypothetical protein
MSYDEPVLRENTFCYILNSADTALEDRLEPYANTERWILTSEWRQNMGNYLPSNIKEFEVQVVRYEWGINHIYNDTSTSLDMATMLYSNLPQRGLNSLAIDSKNNHQLFPTTNYSNICARYNGVKDGATRHNSNLTHRCVFTCKNFNGEHRYFRMNTLIQNKKVNEYEDDFFMNTSIWNPNAYVGGNLDAIALGYYLGNALRYEGQGLNQRVLKSFNNAPLTTFYFTPINPNEPIPRILLKENSIIYTISSAERHQNLYRDGNNQILNTGAHCRIKFNKTKDTMVKRYKCQVIGFNFNTKLTANFYDNTLPNNLQMMFGFRSSCGWNKSRYGYLADNPIFGVEEEITAISGGKGGNGFSNLLSFRPAVNNSTTKQFPTSYGAVMDINNIDQDIEFCVYNTMGYLFGQLGANYATFPFDVNGNEPLMDWFLTLRLFPLD